jgi:hypothetical protein
MESIPGHGEGHIRIDTQGQRLLLPLEPIAVPPVATAIGSHEKMQAAAIGDLPRLLSAFGAANLSIREHLLALLDPPESRYQQIYQQNREVVREAPRLPKTQNTLFLRDSPSFLRLPETA